MLARFERVTWLTFINRTNRISAYTVFLGSGISQLKCLHYDWAREFPDYNLSISLYAAQMVHLCILYLCIQPYTKGSMPEPWTPHPSLGHLALTSDIFPVKLKSKFLLGNFFLLKLWMDYQFWILFCCPKLGHATLFIE